MNKEEFIEIIKAVIERAETDGCTGCAFRDREEWEKPCVSCRRNCRDYWRKGRED